MTPTTHCWILDSGGAGRGAWQGGVIHELMRWGRQQGCYPQISMGASAGGYAAADVATETEATVLKGWTRWGCEEFPDDEIVPPDHQSFWGWGKFRLHLRSSIRYVMGDSELAGVFNGKPDKKLLIFTTRLRRRDGRPIQVVRPQPYSSEITNPQTTSSIEVFAASPSGGSRYLRNTAT